MAKRQQFGSRREGEDDGTETLIQMRDLKIFFFGLILPPMLIGFFMGIELDKVEYIEIYIFMVMALILFVMEVYRLNQQKKFPERKSSQLDTIKIGGVILILTLLIVYLPFLLAPLLILLFMWAAWDYHKYR